MQIKLNYTMFLRMFVNGGDWYEFPYSPQGSNNLTLVALDFHLAAE